MTYDRSQEIADPHCLSDSDAADLLRGAPWRRFAVMGDSFAEGVGGPCPGYADVPWAERVAEALRANQPDLAYLNTGKMGLRTAEVYKTSSTRCWRSGPIWSTWPPAATTSSSPSPIWTPSRPTSTPSTARCGSTARTSSPSPWPTSSTG